MLVLPILNTNKDGVSILFLVEVTYPKAIRVKEGVSVKGLEESDVILNGASFNRSIYNTRGIEPNVITNFLRNFNYKANKKEFLVTTRQYADSDLYHLYSVPIPPRKIAAGLDNLYGSVILDLKKEIPGIKKGRYISLKKLGVDRHITQEKLEKLQYLSETELDKNKRKDIFQLNGVSDLEKTIDFMRLFDFTIIGEATLTEEQLTSMITKLQYVNTRDYRNLSRLYEIAKENREVYSKLTRISKIINKKPLHLIKSSKKPRVLVKTNNESA
ncbi:MAG: hypothetical protein HFJ12_07620 [Bacilli bacterium]|nr:hypothetical protein [Bacilli bacterium]